MPDVKHFDPDEAVAAVVPLVWRQGWAGTGISDIVAATGLSRSSLYATFGNKEGLCLAAVRRYLADQLDPAVSAMAGGAAGLPDVAGYFGRLITIRCAGPRALWGCLAANLLAAPEAALPGVGRTLAEFEQRLSGAFAAALGRARELGQVHEDAETEVAAEHLVLLSHGVNLRSRAGASPRVLRAAVAAALGAVRAPGSDVDIWPQGKWRQTN